MQPALTVALVLCVAMVTVTCADSTFNPGCSFYSGQCVYSIKLGHNGRCDKPETDNTVASTGAGCCKEVSQMKDEFDKLKLKVNAMTSLISNSSKSTAEIEKELQKALAARDDIAAVLNRKESELKSKNAELASIMATAAEKIHILRKEKATCQAALTGDNKKVIVKPTEGEFETGGHALTYYYNFNYVDSGFYFKTTKNRKLSLRKQGYDSKTGPRVEHSWGVSKGSYLGFDARDFASNFENKAFPNSFEAESPEFPPANAYCIMFWYFMEGKDVQTLTGKIKINGGVGYPVFTKTGPVGSKKWELGQIDLDREYTQHTFKIVFTMTSDAHHTHSRGKQVYAGQEGDIAVDDLYVYNTSCSNIPRHPKTYSFYGNKVTSFYTFHLTPKSWYDAYDECRREGPWSALVSIESSAEQFALVNIIRSNAAYNIIGAKGFYTSGSDSDNESQFVWTATGFRRPIEFNYWHAGQPNNVAGNQNCLLMEYPNDNFRWGDVNCDTKHPFICEVEVPGKVSD